VRFNALGWALLNTYPKAELVELSARVDLSGIAEDQPLGHTGQPNSVILVDEIDKAPRDVPNDLLDEFDHYAFTVKELTYNRMDYTVCHSFKAQNGIKPLLIMTSNDERGLPDAFLRRCIFHHIPVPPLASGAEDPEVTLDRILIEHAGHHWSQGGRLAKPFADLFKSLRDQPLKKYPGLSEMMWFLQALKGPGSNQHSRHELRQSALNVLFKSQQDQEIGKEAVDHFVNAVINSKNVD
jgi:MoxR-like ATPase